MTERRLSTIVLLVAASVALNLLLWRLGATTTLRYTRMLVNTQASADSWRPMARALAAWDRGEPIYQTVFFREREKFQYPPSSLLLPLAVRRDRSADLPLFRALNRIGLWLNVLQSYRYLPMKRSDRFAAMMPAPRSQTIQTSTAISPRVLPASSAAASR